MRTANAKNDQIRDQKKAKRIAYWKQYWVMYTMLALTVAYYIIFRYIPMAGNTLAFRRYVPGKGMFGTEWTMRYVERFLKDPVFWKAFKNTLVLVICLVPFMYVLSASFSGPKPLTNGEVFLFPKDFTLNAYVKIIQYPNFLRSYGNTILYTVVGTGICLVMTIFMAFPLAHPKLKGHGFFMKLVVITMFFSGGLIPKFLLVNSLKTTDTIWAIVLPVAINTFNLIVLINFFKTIPRELEEAALIDGMGYFGIMRNIFLPLSIPALATITLYYAVYFWNDWFNALIYVKSARYPVMMILRNLVMGTTQMDVGSMSSEGDTVSIAMKCAVIVTSSVPIIVLYPFLSKYFVKGLTIGGVKG